MPFRPDCRIEGGRDDPFVLRQQIVGEFVKIGNAADHCRCGDDLIALHGEIFHQRCIFYIAFNEMIVRVMIVGFLHFPIL